MSTPVSFAARFRLGRSGGSARGSSGASSGRSRGRSSPLGCACDAGKLSGLACSAPPSIAAIDVTCSGLQSDADAINARVVSSDAAIQASGIGATQPGWLAQWQAWRSSWNLWYTAKLPTCSFLFPYLPGNTNEADLHTELDSQVVQFRAFQQQAVAYGIQIPGGILPDPNASPSSVSWVTWAIVGLVGVAFVAVMVHGASSAAGRIVPVVA